MKLTVRDVVDGVERGLPAVKDRRVELSASFWLGRQAKILRGAYEEFRTARLAKLKECGEEIDPTDPTGKTLLAGSDFWRPRLDRGGEYNRQLDELMRSNLELPIDPRPISHLRVKKRAGDEEEEGLPEVVGETLYFLFIDGDKEE